jgi:hypothetical protein
MQANALKTRVCLKIVNLNYYSERKIKDNIWKRSIVTSADRRKSYIARGKEQNCTQQPFTEIVTKLHRAMCLQK